MKMVILVILVSNTGSYYLQRGEEWSLVTCIVRVQHLGLLSRLLFDVIPIWLDSGEDLALLPFRFLGSFELGGICPHATWMG